MGLAAHELVGKLSIVDKGYLIGTMPDTKTVNDDELLLRSEMNKSGPGSEWIVIGVKALLERAQVSHASVIEALEKDIENGLAEEEPANDDRAEGVPDRVSARKLSNVA